MLKFFFILALSTTSFFAMSQSDSTRVLDLGLEFRPRFEFRDGYRTLTADSLKPATFVSQRSRLNLNFTQRKYTFVFSAQDVRTFGENGSSTPSSGIGVFESYASFPLSDQWNITIGRQGIELNILNRMMDLE
jgi:hypothetical protein